MSQANPRWSAPRVRGKLLKLGIDVCQATIAKYMGRRRQPPSQTWRTFLRNHIGQVVAADFVIVPTATCRLLFVLVLPAHDRRRIGHVAVTAHPTAALAAQQLREAFPWDKAPRYLIHDRGHAFDSLGVTARRCVLRKCSRRRARLGTMHSSSDLLDPLAPSVSITSSCVERLHRRSRNHRVPTYDR
jgi:hypothetical protein